MKLIGFIPFRTIYTDSFNYCYAEKMNSSCLCPSILQTSIKLYMRKEVHIFHNQHLSIGRKEFLNLRMLRIYDMEYKQNYD